MPLLSGITSFFDKYILGYAIGTAAGPSLEPFVQDLANEAWILNPVKPVDPITAAAIVAEDVEQEPWGANQAQQSGIDAGNFQAIVGETLNAPGLGPLFELWRRGLIGDGQFVHGLRKAKLESLWDGPLEGLKDTLLSSQELANLQQQGFVDQARADSEGALQGVTAERQQLRFEASGLPPGWSEGLTMLRRGIIDQATFAQIVREGHTKTKYTDDLLKLQTDVLSPAEYAGLRLRGWITQAEADAGGALSGYTPEQMQLLWLNRGRPATPRQIHLGYARGAKVVGANLTEAEAIARAVHESDIRDEWTDIEAQNVWSYPSPFVLRTLTQAGTFTEAQTQQILIEEGWKPVYAQLAAASWAKGGTAKGKAETKAELADEYETGFISEAEYRQALTDLGYVGHEQDLEVLHSAAVAVKRERDRAVTALHKLYVAHSIDQTGATSELQQLGMQPEAISRILPIWTLERDAERKQLTAAQIRSAYRKNLLTQAVALADLEERGYSLADATTFLAS